MTLDELDVGTEFTDGADPRPHRFRCLEVRPGCAKAIRIDQVIVDGPKTITLDEAAAEEAGLFAGPPYALPVHHFDGSSLSGCRPTRHRSPDDG